VAAIMFEIQFTEIISGIETRLNNFNLVSECLVNWDSIADVFTIILTLGNYMNGGNRERGQADGFGLEILPKLKDVKGKADSRTPTLLHYIVQVYLDKYQAKHNLDNFLDATVALPVPEPQDLEKASLVDFDETEAELKKLSKEIKMMDRKVKKVIEICKKDSKKSDSDPTEPFKSRMEAFLEKAAKEHLEQESNLMETKKKFPETMNFFKYRPKSSNEAEKVKEFFSHWLPFCSDFKDIFKNELLTRKKETLLEIKRKVKQRELERKKPKNFPTTKPATIGGLKDRIKQKESSILNHN
jgi:hypothetical protein